MPNPQGIKFRTRLSPGLSHLLQHKFKHSFQETVSPISMQVILRQLFTICSTAATILMKD